MLINKGINYRAFERPLLFAFRGSKKRGFNGQDWGLKINEKVNNANTLEKVKNKVRIT